MHYNISLFNHKMDNVPKVRAITWADMLKKASRPGVRSTKDGQLMSGTIFAHDLRYQTPRRAKALANETSMLFGDVDHGTTFDHVAKVIDSLRVRALLYTTYSHQAQGEDRLRVCLPLSTPIPASRFDLLWLWFQQQLGGILDPQCKDVSRIVYTPAKSTVDAPYRWRELPGEVLDWRAVDLERFRPAAAPKPTWDESRSEDWDRLLAQLRERIAAHPTAHKNSRGRIVCRGICHDGKSDDAIFIGRGGAVCCSNEQCNLRDILRAFGLPEQPDPPEIEVWRGELARTAGLVIVTDTRQAAHYADRLHCAAVALRRPLAFAGKKSVISIFDHVSTVRQVSIPITSEQRADEKTMRGVRRLVGMLKSLNVRVEVFEVKG